MMLTRSSAVVIISVVANIKYYILILTLSTAAV